VKANSYSLAIETSGRRGSVALGRGGELLDRRDLPDPSRHNLGLMTTIDAACRVHGVQPADLSEVYVSLGPGSFTGLRVGVTAAKMLALAAGTRLVGVPTMTVLAAQAADTGPVAVVLNSKRGTAYVGVFRGGSAVVEPALIALDDLWSFSPAPAVVVADRLEVVLPQGVAVVPAVADAATTWRVGRAMAAEGRFTDAATLSPLYIREPEAVTLWNQRHGG
jgi:tRNA threonylcarbamoyladenosine biosynthesis protein TsaB